MPTENLGDLLGRVSENSAGGIESLIGEFEQLRGRLRTDGERIQREIEDYKALSQQVMELTKTISGSVEKVRASVDWPTTVPQEEGVKAFRWRLPRVGLAEGCAILLVFRPTMAKPA